MNKIKPIDTIYNGYKFRSRLEARWAVFFDALSIKYEYEKEGYELSNGRYLPDFWLYTEGNGCIIAEIKPNNYNEQDFLNNAKHLLKDSITSMVWLFVGNPWDFKLFALGLSSGSSDIKFFECSYLKDDMLASPPCPCTLEQAALKAKQARFEFEYKEI
jgi:hypothetical protein